MKLNKILIVLFASLLMGGFSVTTFASGKISVYEPFVQKKFGWYSGAFDIDIQKIMNDNFVNVPTKIWINKSTKEEKHQAIRVAILRQIYRTKTVNFLPTPYSRNANFGLTIRDNEVIASDIPQKDTLDILIDKKMIAMGSGIENLVFSKDTIQNLGPLFLRKSAADLQTLGYEVVSSRYRTNYDAAYRRHNIITAFGFLGHIRVLNPGERIRYLKDAQFDEGQKKNYKNGLAIVADDEIPVYGGGICGGSTAAYQGFLTNKALDLDALNHSRWFSDLYTATINGQKISTPGIDATVYAWSRELVVTNISDHPIILAMNFNGERGGIEEVFSLGLSEDKGSLEYVGQRVSTKKVSKKSATASGGTYTQTVKTGCYTRNINGKNKTSCYKEIH